MCEPVHPKPVALLWYLIAAKQQNKFNDPISKNMFTNLGVAYPSDTSMFPSEHFIGCIWITSYTNVKNILLSLDSHQRRWLRSLMKPKRGRQVVKPTLYFAYKINRRLFFDRRTLFKSHLSRNGGNVPSHLSKSDLSNIHDMYPEICDINEKHYSVVQERALVLKPVMIDMICLLYTSDAADD